MTPEGSHMPSIAIVWFRRDLRLHDHPALTAAVEAADAVVPLFVFDEPLLMGRWPSANRTWFMRESVVALSGCPGRTWGCAARRVRASR